MDEEDPARISYEVYDFDHDEYDKVITEEDIKGTFEEFCVYTGEYGEPIICPVKVEDLTFDFGDGSVPASEATLASADECLKEVAADTLKYIVLKRYQEAGLKLDLDLSVKIYYDLLGEIERNGIEAAKHRAETAKIGG